MIRLNCLHGFLGSPEDWDGLFNDLPASLNVVKYDFFNPAHSSPPLTGLPELGQWVNRHAQSQAGPKVLLGYSFGGRVALHSLIQSPETWSAAVIISAHPGLKTQTERQTRLQGDEEWAKRFETLPWDQLINLWDSQAVLESRVGLRPHFSELRPHRLEQNFSRKALACALRSCSLGHQVDLRPALRQIQVPILWISGEHDAKYFPILQEVAEFNPRFRFALLSGGGHRIPWEAPGDFVKAVMGFLNTIERF